MKEKYPCPCGGYSPSPAPWDRPPSPPPSGFLMQRILGSGQMHCRRKCYQLCLSCLPDTGCRPLALADVQIGGAPIWEEAPCHEKNAVLLRVTLPLSLFLRDGTCLHRAEAAIEETLTLRFQCSPCQCWRGQITVQAAARLCGQGCVRENGCAEAPLEVEMHAYLIAPCSVGASPQPCCPQQKPWYPQPRFDPYQDLFPPGCQR